MYLYICPPITMKGPSHRDCMWPILSLPYFASAYLTDLPYLPTPTLGPTGRGTQHYTAYNTSPRTTYIYNTR
ncbi:hypothetical protein NEUTE1DRAFT_116752 [Neurospora tetrasperma FGSC 2508]|uniref:Uncharacterized protein n=1 Tax=Neurospora tetrasperma (strain FGSC 2508 / ATCC MYA-4615 / P0657) TaxID=510951 RepID=F8MN60_NEUT8|nr:uncharacterized protein NEUTE1DRAFT_116752 [Neurospora tetrasperma FGSC 2508]EGO57233.1 hypothetical protein NEUTE1DRAFT_116752 [Neurospora tetrasperma FGSC 2508]EGZ72520.1 hypothetical protein NEUTE2DRAFT_144854 [Neurospora tetrasperma FGSC 2509]